MKEEEWTDRCERYFNSIAQCEKKEHPNTKTDESPEKKRKEKWKGHLPPPVLKWFSLLDLHSASFIGNTKSLPLFLFWVLVCVTGVSSLTFLISVRAAHYMNSGSHFVLTYTDRYRPAANTPLSLSVCNLNVLRKSTLEGTRFAGLLNVSESGIVFSEKDTSEIDGRLKDFVRWFESSVILEWAREEYRLFKGMETPSDWGILYRNALNGDVDTIGNALRLDRDELHRHGMNIREDILHCWKDGKPCDTDILTFHASGHHGNCLQINLSKSTNEVFERLAVILHTRPEEYVGLMTSSLGYKIMVHAGFNLSERTEEFLVSPGNTLKLDLRKVSVYHRETCNSDPGYTYRQCKQECMEALSREVCGCSLSIDEAVHDRCRVDVEYQYVCVRVLEKMGILGTLPCRCEEDCSNVHYTTSASSLPWPSESHQEHLFKSLMKSGYQGTSSNIRKELVHIAFTASKVQYETYTERKDITITGLLVEVGALSAFLCGISLITCLEIFIGLLRLLLVAYSKVFQREDQKEGVQRINDADVNTITWSQKGTSQETGKKLHSSTTFLSTLTPLAQSNLDPIKEVETPRTEDHTYEAIYSRISPREKCGEEDRKSTDKPAIPSRARKQWQTTEGAGSGRERWRKPTFPPMEKAALENRVFYGSKDEVTKHFSRSVEDRYGLEWDGFNTMPSPRRTKWPERPAIPPLNLTKMQNADGFWMKRGSLGSADDTFKRRGSGSHVLTWSDFARQYGVPKLQENSEKTNSKNIFYM